MSTIVIMPGGFHPFHAGHAALYQSAVEAFPGAEVFVAATNDTSTRPFPFAIKEKLAKLAGVAPGHFVQVKSPFRAEEITSRFDPEKDRLIFVRSEKDANKPPQAGGNKKDGNPAYLQLLAGQTNIRPFKEHAYMAYLPTVEFGPGMTSATEIRQAWPTLSAKHKVALVMSLYPTTQRNRKLAATVVKLLDTAIGNEHGVAEDAEPMDREFALVKKMGRLGERIVQNPKLWEKYSQAIDTDNLDWIVSLIQEGTGATRDEVMHLSELFGEIGGGLGRLADFAWAVKEGTWEQDFMNPYRQHRSQGMLNELAPNANGGNGPFDYGTAIIRIGEDLIDFYQDEGAGADSADIIQVGKTFISAGMTKGIAALFDLDSQVYDHVLDQLADQGFNVKADIYKKRQRPAVTPQAQDDWNAYLLKRQAQLDATPGEMYVVTGWYAGREYSSVEDKIKAVSPEEAKKKFLAQRKNSKFRKIDVETKRERDTRGDDWETRANTSENQGWAATFTNETNAQNFVGGMTASYQDRENQPIDEDYIDEKWSQKYKSSINCANPKGFSQRAHCAGRKK